METPKKTLRKSYMEEVKQVSSPLKIPPSPFMKNLGFGTGVMVYKLDRSPKCGEMRSPWAVKLVTKRTRENNDTLFNQRIQFEADILRKLSHPNIVGFRGIVKRDGSDVLALECCKISLGDILEERSEVGMGPLPAAETLKMIADIAHALDYLHTEAKLLHGDLKSYNVLVKGDFEICKLCDFGVSLPLDEQGLIDFQKNPTLQYVGTSNWCAPEIMDDSSVIDSKADIFSFGLVIYETIALVVPHTLGIDFSNVDTQNSCSENTSKGNSSCEQSISLETSLQTDELADKGLGTRPPLPQSFELSEEYNRVVEHFYCCTMELSEDRPTAKVIWQSLELNQTNDVKKFMPEKKTSTEKVQQEDEP